MTTDRLRAILRRLEWTPRTLARILELHETGPRKWANGKNEVPQNVADWLEATDAGPKDWNRP